MVTWINIKRHLSVSFINIFCEKSGKMYRRGSVLELVTVRNTGPNQHKQDLKKLAQKPARYIKPDGREFGVIHESKTNQPITLPPIQDSSAISNEDRRLNEEMMAKLISNRYQRELLSDMIE